MSQLPDAAPVRMDSRLRRIVDVAVAGIALALLAPFMAAIAIVVKLTCPGPVFFRQERLGRGGGSFRILKFRSMVPGADRCGPAVSGRHDSRVTSVGRFLRATKLDELPQLLNVIRGEMTLVGPRPEVPGYLRHYGPEELAVLDVRPGIVGPGQIFFTTTQSIDLDRARDPDRYYIEHQLHEKLAVDIAYLRSRSLFSDLAVLGYTPLVMLGVGRRSRRSPRRRDPSPR